MPPRACCTCTPAPRQCSTVISSPLTCWSPPSDRSRWVGGKESHEARKSGGQACLQPVPCAASLVAGLLAQVPAAPGLASGVVPATNASLPPCLPSRLAFFLPIGGGLQPEPRAGGVERHDEHAVHPEPALAVTGGPGRRRRRPARRCVACWLAGRGTSPPRLWPHCPFAVLCCCVRCSLPAPSLCLPSCRPSPFHFLCVARTRALTCAPRAAADVWAFGTVMWELMTWQTPFEGVNPYQVWLLFNF